ncbi:MAG TPA: ATP-grasp domain-containing protein [Candidatus Ornithospirochaeta stercorigallinarum]|nr:ATP-grasp domain-containing protein [Candidatus Ornithospirochaeta stercorigallinarum]
MFSKILIANRGEIAIRIIRALSEMGIKSVAVYSEADKNSLHRFLADESICIGPGDASESYLRADRIISAAILTGAKAIHPGYGFLSENEEFAALCEENGIAFIGPSSELMKKLSDKTKMKEIAKDAGLDTIPGTGILSDLENAKKKAKEIGYPVMLKARSGGGGRGIRLITDEASLEKFYPIAKNEAEQSFSDGALYLEKYIMPASHIEVQILADEQGNAVSFAERDCSMQRNHQKLVEESPSAKVSPEERALLMEKARKAAIKMGYRNAGTMEFLFSNDRKFYFMEMNVRLQVEHPVSEILSSIDIVKWQIRIAAGIPLSFTNKDVRTKGAAIECRINARSTGEIEELHIPGGPFVRFDTYIEKGSVITPYYDSLLGKLIVYAQTRDEAIRKMRAYLCELQIVGVDTNIEEQLKILKDPAFVSGTYDTTSMEAVK